MKKWISVDDALAKLQHFCAYRDRCHQEVRKKLLDLGIYGEDLENIIIQLIEERFLDEERFARSFVRGKFRINKWGKIRIKQELKRREISDYCIRKGMEEIKSEAYEEQLQEIITNKAAQVREENSYKKKNKIAGYVIGRGYEPALVWEKIKEL